MLSPQRRRSVAGGPGKVGHKLSAIGFSYLSACTDCSVCSICSVCPARPSPFLAAPRGGSRGGKQSTRKARISLPPHSFSFRLGPSPSEPCRGFRQADAAGRKGTMAKEICISSTPHETRLAILEDDQLAEIYYERENEYTLAGSIYNGRVTRVLPGMQSAFVDVGLERDAFLYVTDFMELEDPEETDEIEKAAASGANQPPREVRHTPPEGRTEGRNEGRGGRSGQKPEQKPEQKQEPRPAAEKPRGLAVEVLPETEIDTASGLWHFLLQRAGRGQRAGIRRARRQALARTPPPPWRPWRRGPARSADRKPARVRPRLKRSRRRSRRLPRRFMPEQSPRTGLRRRGKILPSRRLASTALRLPLPLPLFCPENRFPGTAAQPPRVRRDQAPNRRLPPVRQAASSQRR